MEYFHIPPKTQNLNDILISKLYFNIFMCDLDNQIIARIYTLPICSTDPAHSQITLDPKLRPIHTNT